MPTHGITNDKVTHINVVSYDHLESETPQNKGVIKSPSKLLSLKYQSQLSLGEQDKNSFSPKRVYFINTITIVKKEDELREPETSELSLSSLGGKKCKDGIEKDNEWIEYEEPLDLVNLYDESVYELIIKEMPSCSLNYDFRIEKGDPNNLKFHCMIGHKFIPNAYIDIDLPMNIMSLAYYNDIRRNGFEYRGENFMGIGRDMHVFIGKMSHVMDFTILKSIEANIDPSLPQVVFGLPFAEIACLAINRKHGWMTFTDGNREVTFKTPYNDPKRSELTSEGHDLLSSRIILSEDNYDRGCKRPFDLKSGFYKDVDKLGPDYQIRPKESSSRSDMNNQGGVM
ncbi:hypothetical protein Tco_0388970 [Tanacetum coccineum]